MAIDKKKGERLPSSEIPEVERLNDLKMEIEALRAQHPDVFMLYDDLKERYNTALDEADKIVRGKGVSCGPWDNYSVSVIYDTGKLYEEIGEELFLKCGGEISKVPQYSIDPKKLEAAIAKGDIPQSCVPHFTQVRRNYHGPKKLT